jgi:ABC-2 type transport system permease protein
MWAICKKEWTQYFSGLTGYLIIGFYLVVNGLFLFVLPNFNIFDFGYTSLQVYFDFAPWFLLLLVPAITMRSFSDEYKQGTFEILSTIPISPVKMVFAKFLGAFAIVAFAILPTLIYAFSLDSLSMVGGLDWGATLGSYFGLFCLAVVYTMVGVFTSSTSKNSLISLLFSIIISILLFKGFDWISSISYFKNGYDYYIMQLGLSFHYQNLSKGVITSIDLIYFSSIAILFGIGAIEQIKGRIKYLIILLVIIFLNYTSTSLPIQIDLTKDHRFTISEGAKEVIKQIDKPIKIHLYLGGDLPPAYKKLSESAKNLLNQFQKLNPNNIKWDIEVPSELYNEEQLPKFYDSLLKMGVPIERKQVQESATDKRVDQLFIPGAIVEVEGKKPIVIDLRSDRKYYKAYNVEKEVQTEDEEVEANAAEAQLEYKFAHSIYLLNRTEVPKVGYLVGNGEPTDYTINDIILSIKDQYALAKVDLKKEFPDASKIKTLLIVKPAEPFSEKDKLKLDQYVMSGGNIIWAIDKLYAEYDSLQKAKENNYVAFDRNLGLDDILFKYGVRINSNLLQNLNSAELPFVVGNNPDGSPILQRKPWHYYPFAYGNQNNQITQNIDRVLTLFPSSIDTIANIGIKKTILLSTDSGSRVIAAPNLISVNTEIMKTDKLLFNKHHLPVAVMLEGKFTSLFANRISVSDQDSVRYSSGKTFLGSGAAISKQIVFADADIITNSALRDEQGRPLSLKMGMLPQDGYQFSNHNFFLNCIAYLNDSDLLTESKNKVIVMRLLDKTKLEKSRTFWQLILILGPLFILAIFYVIWDTYRKKQFAA